MHRQVQYSTIPAMYVDRNIKTATCNRCCSGKAISTGVLISP